ncbi:RluA family pseudouridine synthase [Candidatus Saccharibacteria bacterium]|nr:MAG: RluA family pseudouridine synthase [Candidatus Saccharibacteria bacterium]
MANIEISRAERLDQRVVAMLPQLSRAYAAKLIEGKRVSVNGAFQVKAGYKMKPNDVVAVDYDPAKEESIPDIDLEIVYEDDDCVVINKPVGLLTHSKGAFNPEPTVATWLRKRCERLDLAHLDNRGDEHMRGLTFHTSRAGIVHRLDRATSGVMICAKTPEALSWLQKQFAQRKTKKTYRAVIKGTMNPEAAVIDMPIERNPKAPATFRVGPQGKHAQTMYRTLATGGGYSLLELKPETGRTHQLRVHLAHQGAPIVGDVLYNGEPADRLYLHAEELELTILAGHERKVFRVNTPGGFEDKLKHGS